MNVIKRFITFDTQRLEDLLRQEHLNNHQLAQLRQETFAYVEVGTLLKLDMRYTYQESIVMEQLTSQKERESLALKKEVANFAQLLSQNLFTSELKLIGTISALKETQEALQIQEIQKKSPEEKPQTIQGIFDGLVKSFEGFVKSRKQSAQSIDEIIKKTIYLVRTMVNDHRGLVASARWATGIQKGQQSEHTTIFDRVERENKERFDDIELRLKQVERKKIIVIC